MGLGAVNTAHATGNGLFGLVGFATLNGVTTGGAGGKQVTVKSETEMSDILNQRKKNDDTSPLIIKVASKLVGTGAIGVKEVSNVSIIGVGSGGELEGVGKLDGSNPTEPTFPQNPGETIKCGDINGDGSIELLTWIAIAEGNNGILLAGNNNIIEDCEFYANSDSGLQLSRFNSSYNTITQWPSKNTIKNCYSHSNYDPDNG